MPCYTSDKCSDLVTEGKLRLMKAKYSGDVGVGVATYLCQMTVSTTRIRASFEAETGVMVVDSTSPVGWPVEIDLDVTDLNNKSSRTENLESIETCFHKVIVHISMIHLASTHALVQMRMLVVACVALDC